ncbi:MAG: FAD-dependent thymidylate synthase [Thermotogae bacterium]|nr:FAD-dependent thymidylate synthase [Thermotogota bacterium]
MTIRILGSDERVVRVARISYARHDEEFPAERQLKLLRFLFSRKHLSPFEHCVIVREESKEEWAEKFFRHYRPNLLWYWSDGRSAISLRQLVEFPQLVEYYEDVLQERFPAVYDLLVGKEPSPDRMTRDDYTEGPSVSFPFGSVQLVAQTADAQKHDLDYFTFYVRAPIFLARQWMRHRFGAFNERSMRYVDPDQIFLPAAAEDFYGPESAKLKRGDYDALRRKASDYLRALYSVLDVLKELGVRREIARAYYPLGTMTEFFWTVPRLSLMNFLSLRMEAHAQVEMRLLATGVYRLISQRGEL